MRRYCRALTDTSLVVATVAAIIAFNLAVLAATVAVIVLVLRALGVIG